MTNSDNNVLKFASPVIAHRGASALAPENTLAAFERAHEDGCLWIESDVKLTYDGIPILMHDETLERTTNGIGLVADMKWNELQKLDAGSWFDPAYTQEPIPHLDELLTFIIDHNMRLNLELKPCTGRTKATVMVALIELTKIWPDNFPVPLVSSFDMEALTIAANLHPECPRGLLLEKWEDDWVDRAQQIGASSIHIDEKDLTRDQIEKLVESPYVILTYTVNNPARAKELLHWGVSAVFSDNPGEILKYL